jgi:hypothetical protein
MVGHYASPNVGRLLAQANLILMPTSALVPVSACGCRSCGQTSHGRPTAAAGKLGFARQVLQ